MSELIRLDRLSEFINLDYNPWGVGSVMDIMDIIGIVEGEMSEGGDDWHREHWTKEDHVKRIRYLITAPELEDPIMVDCFCDNGIIYPEPIIFDGWHRLHAHWYLKRKHIQVEFAGLVSLLEYLKGETDIRPE